jgi:hypothetical protein
LKQQRALNLQRDPPSRDSAFLPKLYFEKAHQCTLDETLFRYETVIRTLLDTSFNEESNPFFIRSQSTSNMLKKTRLNRKTNITAFPYCLNKLNFNLKPSKTPF